MCVEFIVCPCRDDFIHSHKAAAADWKRMTASRENQQQKRQHRPISHLPQRERERKKVCLSELSSVFSHTHTHTHTCRVTIFTNPDWLLTFGHWVGFTTRCSHVSESVRVQHPTRLLPVHSKSLIGPYSHRRSMTRNTPGSRPTAKRHAMTLVGLENLFGSQEKRIFHVNMNQSVLVCAGTRIRLEQKNKPTGQEQLLGSLGWRFFFLEGRRMGILRPIGTK